MFINVKEPLYTSPFLNYIICFFEGLWFRFLSTKPAKEL